VKIWWLLSENSTTYTVFFSISEKLDFWTYSLLKPDDSIEPKNFKEICVFLDNMANEPLVVTSGGQIRY
jgi:hypothetical protein